MRPGKPQGGVRRGRRDGPAALVEKLADDIVDRAREQADEVLDAARERADHRLDSEKPAGPASKRLARDALAQERSDEDVVLKKERATADSILRWEREEQARVLAALLPLEREKTDRYLLTERGQVWHGIFDWGRMLQVAANLVANSMKFTPRGGTITIKVADMGDQIRVSVLDTGDGIAESLRETISERFGQANGSDQTGLGLGLYISKCIVEAHGGRIWAEGNPAGNGSAFHFSVPAAGDALALRTPPA